MKNTNLDIKCIFCGKTRAESSKILVSGEFSICDKCVLLFNGLLENSKPSEKKAKEKEIKQESELISEEIIPQLNSIEIKKFLDKNVIGQEEAKIALSVSIVNHYKRMLYETTNYTQLDKSNLIITGPSGSGKSLLIKTISKFLNVPFVSIDATTLTEAGYIGENVDTIISRLLANADGDIEAAQQGIVFIDEIDKIATGKTRSSTSDKHVSGVQAALLKMVEGSIVRIPSPSIKKSFIPQLVEVDTTNILFICGGAFEGLNEIVINRLKKKSGMGFTDAPINNKTLETEYSTEDFIEYGIIPEFIGRFPLHTYTTALSTEELIKVLTDLDNNMLFQYKFYFEIDDIDIEFTDEFIAKLAAKAKMNKTGVRGLKGLCDSIMSDHLSLLPEYKKRGIFKLIFDESCIDKKSIPKFEFTTFKEKVKTS